VSNNPKPVFFVLLLSLMNCLVLSSSLNYITDVLFIPTPESSISMVSSLLSALSSASVFFLCDNDTRSLMYPSYVYFIALVIRCQMILLSLSRSVTTNSGTSSSMSLSMSSFLKNFWVLKFSISSLAISLIFTGASRSFRLSFLIRLKSRMSLIMYSSCYAFLSKGCI